jgi:hypothetical protein
MKSGFQGWEAVGQRLYRNADEQQRQFEEKGDARVRLNSGQRASLRAIARRIGTNGLVIADEVGMGKTRIAVELTHCVVESGGRVAILIPPGLGYQWQAELRDGGMVDTPPILRSLWAYFSAWEADVLEQQRPWFDEKVVPISHAFTNWRLGQNAATWRWGLLPEIYARWRAAIEGRYPRGYHEFARESSYSWVSNAASSIIRAIPDGADSPARRQLNRLLKDITWPAPLSSVEYGNGRTLRESLERSVGLGLGVFDLVVIDEAHKSRGTESGLSRLLDNVLLQSRSARRFAMTATPVELDASQWRQTLTRIGSDGAQNTRVIDAITEYAQSVRRIRRCWRSSKEARVDYAKASANFKVALAPYLLRRDKTEDEAVQSYARNTGEDIHGYRHEHAITVDPIDLSPSWRQAICAAEAYSLCSSYADDPKAKRLRLTMGSGYGLADVLDRLTSKSDEDNKQMGASAAERIAQAGFEGIDVVEAKRNDPRSKKQQRADWWLAILKSGFSANEYLLFDHPAILATVKAVEAETIRGEKVLVFGRFTRPLRALVQLLNAREMLRRIESHQPWPQAKVHGEGADSEWPAIRAAHRQMNSTVNLEVIDEILRTQYLVEQRWRQRLRDQLITTLEKGFSEVGTTHRVAAIFAAFKQSANMPNSRLDQDRHPIALVSRALGELIGSDGRDSVGPRELVQAFSHLIDAVSDRDDADDYEALDEMTAATLWQTLEERLHSEYNRPQGAFARLMFGETKPESRRMIQLAFNRKNSFPRVLVAQSMVGREGLNLHQACRIVVLLHPEWNPGVVEQQIGRVDRVGSHWSAALALAIDRDVAKQDFPHIEIRPVIFRGTYDEYNWQVLQERWDDLRAQLHGVVVPVRHAAGDTGALELIEEIARAAPKFSPQNE